jgi:hypothetical protein
MVIKFFIFWYCITFTKMSHHGTGNPPMDLTNYAGPQPYHAHEHNRGPLNPWQPGKPEGPSLGSQAYSAIAGLAQLAYRRLAEPFQTKIDDAKEFLRQTVQNETEYNAACAILNGLNGNDPNFIITVGSITTTPKRLADHVMRIVARQRAQGAQAMNQGGKKKSRKSSKSRKTRKNRKTRSRK